MKSLKTWGGASAIGEANLRTLDKLDLPSAKSPGTTVDGAKSVAYKSDGGFRKVITEPQKMAVPYLWGTYLVAPNSVKTALFSPDDNVGRTQRYTSTYGYGTINVDAGPLKVFVGDEYILRMFSDLTNIALPEAKFWPAIFRATSPGREYLANENGHERRSISYIDVTSYSGLGEIGHNAHLYATGWSNDSARYRFGFTAMVSAGDGTNAPVCFAASTGQYTMSQVSFPYYSGRNHSPVNTYCVGPGKLRAIVNVTLSTDFTAPVLLVQSSDHGLSWSSSSPEWLTASCTPPDAFGSPPGTGGGVAAANIQRGWVALKHVSIYIGSGKSFTYISNARKPPVPGDMGYRYTRALFLESGGAFTRLVWPPDTWGDVDAAGAPLTENTKQLAFQSYDLIWGAQFGFGENCAFFSMIDETSTARILFTHDAGSSWTISEPIPNGIGFAPGTVIMPFVAAVGDTPEDPGRIIFAAPNYVTNKLRFYMTDGRFAKWMLVGNAAKPAGVLAALRWHGRHFVNYGGSKYKPRVFPAYPNEFSEPPKT